MKFFLLIFFMCSFVTLMAADPFVLPKDTNVINRDDSGKTWRMNGSLNLSFDASKKVLLAAVKKAEFKLKHEIIMDEENKNHILVVWTKEKQILMMMIWTDPKETFFCWGAVPSEF